MGSIGIAINCDENADSNQFYSIRRDAIITWFEGQSKLILLSSNQYVIKICSIFKSILS